LSHDNSVCQFRRAVQVNGATLGTESEDDRMDVDPAVFGTALLAASSADPGDLLDVLRAELRRRTGALDVAMHLIDYRLMSLRPVAVRGAVRLPRPEPVDGSVLGTAFRTQQDTGEAVPAGQLCHIPISVRGQRLGVLTGTFARPSSAADRTVLRSLALAAAHALLEMSAGTDVYETSRRHGSLSVAAEMQWQLLPARAFRTSDYYIAGHLEPALRVAGDAYDFAINDGTLTAVVIDATSTSGAPSGLTTLVVTALRNARRSGLSLAEQASLANDVIWQHTNGQEHASAVLLQIDAERQQARIVDAGSPAIVRVRDGQLEPQAFDSQTPLGMFEGTDYADQPIDLRPGDRVYLITDGALGADLSVADILDLLSTEDHGVEQSPPESIRRLVATLTHGGQEPDDDITLVCLDWLARSGTAWT
jgi:Stage II sporulation protein E (SpoIIE)